VDLRSDRHLHQNCRRKPEEVVSGGPYGRGIVNRRGKVAGSVGIGLRLPHASQITVARPQLGFLEVHPENYMGESTALDGFLELRRDYPVSVHGVALSLGSAEELDRNHLVRLKALVDQVEPMLVSEHLAWSAIDGVYLSDLLPLPYTQDSLDLFCRHVDEVQHELGRQLLIENPASYLRFRQSSIPEPEFMTEIARRTGCGDSGHDRRGRCEANDGATERVRRDDRAGGGDELLLGAGIRADVGARSRRADGDYRRQPLQCLWQQAVAI
jgi:hypothetical protein